MKILAQDHHYDFDDVTREITFKKEHPAYQAEKKVFARHGVDIDEIKTVNEYDLFKLEYRHDFIEMFEQKWRKVKPKTVEEKYQKSLMLNDLKEFQRLKKIIKKKRSLNLKVIK